ncbi:MAG: hypothetical protein AAB573_05055 [Patescibacteria group bacterium]
MGERKKIRHLLASDLIEIRERLDDGGFPEKIAKDYGTTVGSLNTILYRFRNGKRGFSSDIHEARWQETKVRLQKGDMITDIARDQGRSDTAVCQEADRRGYTKEVRQKLREASQ